MYLCGAGLAATENKADSSSPPPPPMGSSRLGAGDSNSAARGFATPEARPLSGSDSMPGMVGMGAFRNDSSCSSGAHRTRLSALPNSAPIMPGMTPLKSCLLEGSEVAASNVLTTALASPGFWVSPGTLVHVGSNVMSMWFTLSMLAMSSL